MDTRFILLLLMVAIFIAKWFFNYQPDNTEILLGVFVTGILILRELKDAK